ncbi:MAG: MFS transporter [Halobaculum sp.]
MGVTRQIRKYYVYRGLSALGVLNPFLILFLLDRGITFTAISVAATAMAVTTVALEVPSGYLGDRIGRRRVIVLAKAATAIATSLWFVADSLAWIVLIQVLNGLGIVLKSGSDSAWLFELLEESDREFTGVRSRAQRISQWSYGTTGIVGAGLYLTFEPAAFVLAAVGAWAAVAVAYTFPDSARYEPDEPAVSVREAVSLTVGFLSNDAARPLILLGAVYAGVMYTGSQFIQPLVATAVDGTAVQIAGVGVHEVVTLALLYALLSSASGWVVDYADTVKAKLGVAPAILAVDAVGAGAMLLPLLHPALVVPAIVAFRAVPQLAAPIRNGYLHEHADSVGRATEMSAISFLYAVSRIPVLLVAGRVADLLSPLVAFAGLGAYVFLAGGLVVLLDRPLTVSPDRADHSPVALSD